MIIHKKRAKKISYGRKRKLKTILYIAIHYTGIKNDTAKNNAYYFANGNTRTAGAHYFVDDKQVWESIPMKYEAYGVGGLISKEDGAAKYYGKCTNLNSVSIELCDCLNGASKKQIKLTKKLIKRIRRKAKNAKVIVRHWDVSGKDCPKPYIGKNNKKWEALKKELNGK